MPQDQFPVVTLLPLDGEQIERFVQDWYRVTGPLPPRFWKADRCEQEARDLNDAIRQRNYLMDLAVNPLLLTLMAQVHGRDGTLPNDRADLYDRAVRLLLERWEARLERDERGERRHAPGIYQQIGKTPDEVCVALQQVAFTAHQRQGTEESGKQPGEQRGQRPANIPRVELLEQLAQFFDEDLGIAQRAADFIQQRAGLLVAQSGGMYSFPHRTFQEYLAARHAMRQGEPATLLCGLLWDDLEWWREVYLLAAGTQRKTPRLISELADDVLLKLPTDARFDGRQLDLALAVEQALRETRFAEEVKRGEQPRFVRTHDDFQQALLHAMASYDTLEPAPARRGRPSPGPVRRSALRPGVLVSAGRR